MPKIVWPQQPERIRAAWLRHRAALPEGVAELLVLEAPPVMGADLAKAFLRCFYAARDLDRTERDVAGGGAQTDGFAARAIASRVAALEARMETLRAQLASH